MNGRPQGAPTNVQIKKEHRLKNAGITLIALIITIILLLILAGVALHFTLGENGILRNAGIAGNKYKEAEENETNKLDEALAYMNGKEINYPPNSIETKAGARVQMPNNWYIQTTSMYSLESQKTIKESKRTASVYAVSDGLNNTIPIPKGFYYVGGNLNSGVVISDNAKDEGKYKNEEGGAVPSGLRVVEENGVKRLESELQGNQFVWIPCIESNYHKTNWGQGNTDAGNCYWSTETTSYEINQIKKYGGYYIGRYEASLPEEIQQSNDGLVATSKDVCDFCGIPQSKAGKVTWNFINWENAQASAIKMYENNETVASGLITGTQWDVMINKIASIDSSKNLTDSAQWGNYYRAEEFQYTGRVAIFTGDWSLFTYGEILENKTKANKTYYILTTGASNRNKAYNVYDVAGNLWEWTEESAAAYNKINTFETYRNFRGGGFEDDITKYSARYRYSCDIKEVGPDIGFRVVLQIK